MNKFYTSNYSLINVYKSSNFKEKVERFSYASKIKVEKTNSQFAKFQDKWIEKKKYKTY